MKHTEVDLNERSANSTVFFLAQLSAIFNIR